MPFCEHNDNDDDNDNDNENDNNNENDHFGLIGEHTSLCQNLNSVIAKLSDAELLVSEENCDQND